MNKLPEHFDVFLPPVELFFDDLQELLRMTSEFDQNCKLTNDNYTFDSLTEFLEYCAGASIHNFQIYCPYPSLHSLTISVNPQGVYVSIHEANEDPLRVKATFDKLVAFLRTRIRVLSRLHYFCLVFWVPGWAMFIMGCVGLALFSLVHKDDLWLISSAALVVASGVLVQCLMKIKSRYTGSLLHFTKRSELPSTGDIIYEWVDPKGIFSRLLTNTLWVGLGALLYYVYLNWPR
jgi:hypothetical protein